MNFPPFGGHFPSTIPSIHQFATDSSSGTGSRYNHFPNQPPIGVPVVGKYRPENNGIQSAQSQVMMNNKVSYPNSNVHHYPNVSYSQAQSVQQRPTNSPGIQEKRSYHQVKTYFTHRSCYNQLKINSVENVIRIELVCGNTLHSVIINSKFNFNVYFPRCSNQRKQ